jgi:hypothetical protein
MNVAAGASVAVTPASSQATTLKLSALSVAPTGHFDLANNIVLVNYGSGSDPIATLAGYIRSGFNNQLWNGFGIDSSTAAANLGYGIGYADAADAGNPANLAAGTIKIVYTLLGDSDLNGMVNGADFANLAANFNLAVTGWDKGDFDYNNLVNGADAALIGANFNLAVNLGSGSTSLTNASAVTSPSTTQPPTTTSPATPPTTPSAKHSHRRRHN